MKKTVAVVGAGLAGLSAALRLAAAGYDVSLFEKNSLPGGKASQISLDSFRFDAGPSLLTMNFVLEELFSFINLKMDDHLTLLPLQTLCRYYYPDGSVINAHANPSQFADEVEAVTNDKASSVKDYLAYSKKIYDLTAGLFLFNSFKEPSTFLNFKALKTLLNINKIDPFRTVNKANESFFKDPRTIQLFNRYATYNGSNPYLAPATLNIIPHVECSLGASLPDKGIHAIPLTLTKIAEALNIKIYTNSSVEKILHKDKEIKGIRVNGTDEYFDIVVAGTDVNYTYRNLFQNPEIKESNRYNTLTPSSSALVFYWGIKGYKSPLITHNILFSENYKTEFDDLFTKKITPKDPTVYLYISSKMIPADAPPDGENWFVMVNAPYMAGQNWEKEIKDQESTIKNKINRTLGINISDYISAKDVLTPPLIQERTNSYLGSLYGISSNNRNAAFLRQNNRSGYFRNLYFCGGSAHPGGGIPLVLLSGKIAADLIRKDHD